MRYTLNLTNGAQTVPDTSKLSLTVQNVTADNKTCWRTSGVPVPLDASALGSPILGNEVLTCSFDVVVLDVHENAGEIQHLTVQAAYIPTSDVLFIPTTTGQIDPWPVYTNSTMASITYSVDTTSPPPIYGKSL